MRSTKSFASRLASDYVTHPLANWNASLAAHAECRGNLAEPDIAEPYIAEQAFPPSNAPQENQPSRYFDLRQVRPIFVSAEVREPSRCEARRRIVFKAKCPQASHPDQGTRMCPGAGCFFTAVAKRLAPFFLTAGELQATVRMMLVVFTSHRPVRPPANKRRTPRFAEKCMGRIMAFWRRFLQDSEAATAVEYAVMLAMILIAVISAIGAVGGQAGGFWGGIQTNLNSAGFGGS